MNQEKYWQRRLTQVANEYPEFTKEEVEDFSIRFTANPEYAYHTTGGAVDLTIINFDTKEELDMGTGIDEFSEKAYTHFTDLSREVLKNREILYKQMLKRGFYNFPSEWWHFSYGTTDWALHYKKLSAIYGVI